MNDEMKKQIADILLDLGAVEGAVLVDEQGNETPMITKEEMQAAKERKKKS